ncbi:MAG: flagellar filament capping protein FliD [Solirubrobacterales bacterium]
MAVSGVGGLALSGMVSGMDTESVIAKMMSTYQATGDVLYSKKNNYKLQKTALQNFNMSLMRLQNAAFDLRLATAYESKTVTSSDQTILTATAGSGAVNGSHTVRVDQLARAARITSNVLSPRVSNNPANTIGLTGISGAQIGTPAGLIGRDAEGAPAGTIASNIGSGSNSLTVTYSGTTVTVSLADATQDSTTMTAVASDMQTKINEALNLSRGTQNVDYLEVLVTDAGAGVDQFFLRTKFAGSQQSVSVSSTCSAAAALGFSSPADVTTIAGTDPVGGQHSLTVTNATAGAITSTAHSANVDILAGDTIDLTINGTNRVVDLSALAGTYDWTNDTTMDGLAASLTTTINAAFPATSVAAAWSSTSHQFTFTDSVKGASNSIVVNADTPTGALHISGTASGTDASVVDVFTPTSGTGYTTTLTDTTDAGFASSLAGLYLRINGSALTLPGQNDTGGEGALISGVGVTAAMGLTAGTATIETTRGNELNTQLATAATFIGGSDVATTTLTTSQTLALAGFRTAATSATNGTFSINGKQITISNYATTTVNQVIAMINGSGAGVSASYDTTNDRFVLTANTKGSGQSITLGAGTDTSNFLQISKLDSGLGGSYTAGQNDGTVDLDVTLASSSISKSVSTGIFSINGVSIYVNPSSDTMSDVIEKINTSAAGVTASYNSVNDTFSLVSKDDGTGKDVITLGGSTDTSNFLWAVNLVYPPMAELGRVGGILSDDILQLPTALGTPGIGAKLEVDGTSYVRSTNSIDDIVGGLTLNLKAVSSNNVTVDVSSSTDQAFEKMKTFIVQYNTIMEQSNQAALTQDQRENELKALTESQLSALSADDIAAYNANRDALLQQDYMHRDTTVKGLHASLRRIAGEVVSGGDEGYRSLSEIGISTGGVGSAWNSNLNGQLLTSSTDPDVIETALKNNSRFMNALKEAPDKVLKLISRLEPSEGKVTGTKSVASVTLSVPINFMVGNGSTSAKVTLAAGTYSSANLVSNINTAITGAGITDVQATLNSANQLILRAFTADDATSGTANLDVTDMSGGLLNSVLGIQPGRYYGTSVESQSGLGRRIENLVKSYTKSQGLLNMKVRDGGSIDKQIATVENSITAFENRLSMVKTRLWKQFSAMESYMSNKNSISSWLSGQVANMNGTAK